MPVASATVRRRGPRTTWWRMAKLRSPVVAVQLLVAGVVGEDVDVGVGVGVDKDVRPRHEVLCNPVIILLIVLHLRVKN